jgi:pilus assembly protein CpaC
MSPDLKTHALILGLAVTPAGAGLSARAQTPMVPQAATQSISVAKDKSATFHLDAPVGKIVVSQPDVAEIVATTNQSFYIRGKAVGSTNILIYDRSLRLRQVIDLQVGYDAPGLQRDIAAALPHEHIVVSNLAGGLLVGGEASTASVADRALALAERAAPKAVTSAITVRDSQQIALDVRILEVNRTALEDFGIDIAADSGGGIVFSATQGLAASPAGTLTLTPRLGVGSLTATLRALEQKGVARTLAKPNLVALSGQDASFLAGGEIPVPIPSGTTGGIGIEYRQFGVQLNFTPTLYPNGLIRLKVAPEVSQLDQADGVTIVGYKVPALTVRKASTTIELRDGQSFAIAGLFQNGYNNNTSQLPGVGQIPVLGALFRSASWQRNETELVIIVTPHLVTGDPGPLPDPLANAREPSAIDVILDGVALDKPMHVSVSGSKG